MSENVAPQTQDSTTDSHKAQVRIHIDQKPYESPSPTTGEALYALGKVPSNHELFREVDGAQEDMVIPRDAPQVRLKEDDHFHAGPRELTIIVNGRKKLVTGRKLSFAAILALAFDPVPTGSNFIFTITYRNGPHKNPEGTLKMGCVIRIQEGMVFNVTATDRS
jgi:hypothetical protein